MKREKTAIQVTEVGNCIRELSDIKQIYAGTRHYPGIRYAITILGERKRLLKERLAKLRAMSSAE